jgi:hypothetical protein
MNKQLDSTLKLLLFIVLLSCFSTFLFVVRLQFWISFLLVCFFIWIAYRGKMLDILFKTQRVIPRVVRHDPLGPAREPLPSHLRIFVYERASYRCENPFCQKPDRLEIHHIDMDHENNKMANLIAICKVCHDGAHTGKFTERQLYNWAMRDYKKLQGKNQSLSLIIKQKTG